MEPLICRWFLPTKELSLGLGSLCSLLSRGALFESGHPPASPGAEGSSLDLRLYVYVCMCVYIYIYIYIYI